MESMTGINDLEVCVAVIRVVITSTYTLQRTAVILTLHLFSYSQFQEENIGLNAFGWTICFVFTT